MLELIKGGGVQSHQQVPGSLRAASWKHSSALSYWDCAGIRGRGGTHGNPRCPTHRSHLGVCRKNLGWRRRKMMQNSRPPPRGDPRSLVKGVGSRDSPARNPAHAHGGLMLALVPPAARHVTSTLNAGSLASASCSTLPSSYRPAAVPRQALRGCEKPAPGAMT